MSELHGPTCDRKHHRIESCNWNQEVAKPEPPIGNRSKFTRKSLENYCYIPDEVLDAAFECEEAKRERDELRISANNWFNRADKAEADLAEAKRQIDEIAATIARLYPDAENGPVEPSEPSIDFIVRNLSPLFDPEKRALEIMCELRGSELDWLRPAYEEALETIAKLKATCRRRLESEAR